MDIIFKFFNYMKKSPYIIILMSFLVAIFFGGLILSTPITIISGSSMNLIDSFFVATSALCVTGLSTVDVSTTYNLFGKTIILVLIQLGGLGIITFTSMIIVSFARKIDYQTKKIVQEDINIDTTYKIEEFVKKVFLTVIIIEGIGAFFLFFEFIQKYNFFKAIYYAIFHSISAFCNAGFSLFSNSFESFSGSLIINIVVPFLIFLGGLGFSPILNLYNYYITKKERRLTTTSKLSLKLSLCFLLVGAI